MMYTCKSEEKHDKGREFYVHKKCFEDWYVKEGSQN